MKGRMALSRKMCASHESIHCELSAGTLPTVMEQMHPLAREICASSLVKPPLSPSPSALTTCNHTLRSFWASSTAALNSHISETFHFPLPLGRIVLLKF